LAIRLVVVAIIAILAALFLATLLQTRDPFVRGCSVSNPKQINTGIMMYAHDPNGGLPSLVGGWCSIALNDDDSRFI
jgi:hypothetical protein